MATIVKPSRQVSFSDLAKVDPRHFPADRLDSQIQNLIDAIHSTQMALADVRRDDGQLKMPPEQRRERAELENLEDKLVDTADHVAISAAVISSTAKDVHLRVKDAEIAAFTSVNSLAAVERQAATAKTTFDDAENAADRSEYYATQSQNSANFSQAQTDNAIQSNVEAAQWAEYLAGPVVNAADAPAYIAGHPFGHGLYYQPVEGYGGMAGLWSAKWWAVYAAQLVGPWSFYYLGSWPYPPVPGAVNPATGVKVPNPLAPGSFYYNTTANKLYVWDGTQWNQPYTEVISPGIASSYTYVAVAGQTIFSGADAYGKIPVVGISPSDVYIDGLRQVYGADYSVNASTSTLTLVTPATAGAVVQWDLLSGIDPTVGVTVRKVSITPTPDGTNTVFTMVYVDPVSGTQAVDVTGAAQLQIVLDGVPQEPGTDFTADGANLSMAGAPLANSRFWGLWYVAAAADAPTTPAAPLNLSAPQIVGSVAQGATLTSTTGSWTGYPVPTYAYQWKSAGTNVGANQNTYVSVSGDIGKKITVVVTATNASGSASAASAEIGPITAPPPVAPANSTPPTIVGTPSVNTTLTISGNAWSGSPTPTLAYAWNRNGTAIPGATAATYKLVTADLGANITVTVTATNAGGSSNVTSALVGPVTAAHPSTFVILGF